MSFSSIEWWTFFWFSKADTIKNLFDSKVCFGNLEKQLPTDANMRVNIIWMFSKDSSIFHDNVLLLMGLMVSLISVHWFYPTRGQDVVVHYQQNTIRENHIFGLRVYVYAYVPVLSYLILRLFCFYTVKRGWRTIWRYSIFANSLDGISVMRIKMVGIRYFSHLTVPVKYNFW